MFRFFNIFIRVVFTLSLLISSWYLPFWLTVSLFLLGAIVFNWFVEGVFVLLSIDVLFYTGYIPLLALAGIVVICLRAVTYHAVIYS